MEELCHKFNITHRVSSSYYSQVNGLVKEFNNTLVNILKKIINDARRDWHLKIFLALWAYRTIAKTTTDMTPFSLVYGEEVVLPLEVEIPYPRIATQSFKDEKGIIATRLVELESLDEKRLFSR